jgi:hypothetical protein
MLPFCPHEAPVFVGPHASVLVCASQAWHLFIGSVAPLGYAASPMKQPASHAVPRHTSPTPQLAPVRPLQSPVLLAGWQTSHPFAGLVADASTTPPSITHSLTQAPVTQTSPLPHAMPVGTLVQAVGDSAGEQI